MHNKLPMFFHQLYREAKQREQDPRFHGNGFVQLYLSKTERLHVFHPELIPSRVKNALIHDHRWDMHSTVLLGLLHHTTFDVLKTNDGPYSIKEVPGACNKDQPLVEVPSSRCLLAQTGVNKFAAGSNYRFPQRMFHEAGCTGLTMTVIVKSNDDGRPARVISPHGELPDHAYATQPTITAMWQAIEEAYRTWRD